MGVILCVFYITEIPAMELAVSAVMLVLTSTSVVVGQTPSPLHVHHNNSALQDYLLLINSSYPDITHLYSIGKSTRGQELWVLAIGESPNTEKPLRPSVKYVGNIHGNEVVGREHMIHLIDYYVKAYGVNDTITEFLKNTVVHIMPNMNPDGHDDAQEGDCNGVTGRYTANGIDMNRNFPDYWHGKHATPIQNETQAVMDWLPKHNFVLSANLHGGALLANYPYDQYINASIPAGSGPSVCPDEDVFRFLSLTYARSHHTMAATNGSCDGGSGRFPDGITNGAEWYPVAGGMQDYNYLVHGIAELTLELSCCKYPNTSDLEPYWTKNKDAYINLLMQVHRGVKGVITDENNNAIIGANITIKGRESVPFQSRLRGEYYRLLMPGTYTLQVNVSEYNSTVNQEFTVPEGRSVQIVNVKLLSLQRSSSATLQPITQSCLTLIVLVSVYLKL